MGAGVIPISVADKQVRFLFHKTFSGRRAGYLMDFIRTRTAVETGPPARGAEETIREIVRKFRG